jgi:cytochrome b561
LIAAHVSAMLWHTVAIRDGMLSRMSFLFRRHTGTKVTLD